MTFAAQQRSIQVGTDERNQRIIGKQVFGPRFRTTGSLVSHAFRPKKEERGPSHSIP
jgi:hypothetical protein